jgi:putative heme iron utilization protein
VLSTVSSHASSAGFPFGSVVEFAVDAQGRPLLATSTLSPHTADLQADGRCSITVMAPGFKVGKWP